MAPKVKLVTLLSSCNETRFGFVFVVGKAIDKEGLYTLVETVLFLVPKPCAFCAITITTSGFFKNNILCINTT